MKLIRMLSTVAVILILSYSAILCVNADTDFTEYMDAPASAEMASAYLLVNIDDNVLLAQKNADIKLNPASTVKILAGLIACESLADRLDEKLTVTKEMTASFEGYSFGLAYGEKISYRSLLEIAICGSFNDAYIALAYAISGSTSGFIQNMNTRAAQLGVADSLFTDITGIHCGEDVTANDLMLCCREAYNNALYMELSSARSYEIPATNIRDAETVYNRNHLIYDKSGGLYRNPHCRGMNSGSTDKGGCCLAAAAEKDGVNLICIVLGACEDSSRIYSYVIANQLINNAFSGFSRVELTQYWSGKTLTVNNSKQLKTKIEAIPANTLTVYLPKSKMTDGSLTFSALTDGDSLSAPIVKGQTVGYLSLKLDGNEIGRVPLLASDSIDAGTIIKAIETVGSYLGSRAFIISAFSFVLLTLLYIIVFKPSPQKSRRVKPPKPEKVRRFKR